MRLLILCTGNSCRSQMAAAFVQRLRPEWEVHSAGTLPAGGVHPLAIKVMGETGIDLSAARPRAVEEFLDQAFDYVITVCDYANETCPQFTGQVKQRLHMGFDDPAEAIGTDTEVLVVFRRVRDEIWKAFERFVAEADE
ncbi:MAG: arsenate reductase ArsC [Candidatus Marinimicrobia bacterium]|nr:arsenate reductase ArsC [Candidatus Neomarinimicrobiota bacterium]